MKNELVRKVEQLEVRRIVKIPQGIINYVNRIYQENMKPYYESRLDIKA